MCALGYLAAPGRDAFHRGQIYRPGRQHLQCQVYYIVANHPPKIDLTQRWFLWEQGRLEILPGDLPLMDVTIDISDPQGRWPALHRNYSPRHLPKRSSGTAIWQILAPAGEYNVTIQVTDLSAQQIEAHGVIIIPPVLYPNRNQTWLKGIWNASTEMAQPY